jgi:hypothetical protein
MFGTQTSMNSFVTKFAAGSLTSGCEAAAVAPVAATISAYRNVFTQWIFKDGRRGGMAIS